MYLKSWFVLDFVSSFPFDLLLSGLMPRLTPARLLKIGQCQVPFRNNGVHLHNVLFPWKRHLPHTCILSFGRSLGHKLTQEAFRQWHCHVSLFLSCVRTLRNHCLKPNCWDLFLPILFPDCFSCFSEKLCNCSLGRYSIISSLHLIPSFELQCC